MADASNTSALLLAQAMVVLSRSDLRWEFANTAAAFALLSIALAAIALFCFRRRTRDLTLIYFGLLCILYAVRLLAALPSFRSLFDESRMFWVNVNWVITCTIILPLGLFLYQLADEHLRKFFHWLLGAQTVFAVFGILAAAFRVSLTKLFFANNFVVLGTLAATALFLVASKWRPGPRQRLSHEFRVFIAGFLVWMLFVVNENLLGLKILPGHSVEFLVSWFSSRVSGTSPRTGLSRAKNDSSPSTRSWKSPAGFSPPFFPKAFPPSEDSKLLRATSP